MTKPTLPERLRAKAATYDWTGAETARLLNEAADQVERFEREVLAARRSLKALTASHDRLMENLDR